MPSWFWYIPTALIVALTGYVLWRHFFRKKGDCCGECSECGKSCKHCESKNQKS